VDAIVFQMGEKALPALRRALRQPEGTMREAAVFFLGHLRSYTDQVLDLLTPALSDPEGTVRLQALLTMDLVMKNGKRPYADSFLPTTLKALKDRWQPVRCIALACIEDMQADAESALPAVMEHFDEPDPEMVDRAWKTAMCIAPRDSSLALRLRVVRWLKSPEWADCAAVPLLPDIAPETFFSTPPPFREPYGAEAACRFWMVALKDKDAKVRAQATELLDSQVWGILRDGTLIDAKTEAMRTIVLPALSDPDEEVRDWAVHAIVRFDLEAELGLPALLRHLGSSEAAMRLWVIEKLGDQGKEGLEAVVSTLKDSSKLVRERAAQILMDKGADPAVAGPALVDAIKDFEPIPRIAAAATLIKLDPSSEAAMEVLSLALKDPSHSVRCYTIRRIRDGGATAQALVPLLRRAEGDPSPEVQALAAEALKSVLKKEPESAGAADAHPPR